MVCRYLCTKFTVRAFGCCFVSDKIKPHSVIVMTMHPSNPWNERMTQQDSTRVVSQTHCSTHTHTHSRTPPCFGSSTVFGERGETVRQAGHRPGDGSATQRGNDKERSHAEFCQFSAMWGISLRIMGFGIEPRYGRLIIIDRDPSTENDSERKCLCFFL